MWDAASSFSHILAEVIGTIISVQLICQANGSMTYHFCHSSPPIFHFASKLYFDSSDIHMAGPDTTGDGLFAEGLRPSAKAH